MALNKLSKAFVLAGVLVGFSAVEAESMDGLSDGGLYMFGQAIQREFQKKNDVDSEGYATTSEPVSPFELASSISDNFDGEEEPD